MWVKYFLKNLEDDLRRLLTLFPQVSPSMPTTNFVDAKNVVMTTNTDEFENEHVRIDSEQRIVGGSVTGICYRILCSITENESSEIDEDCHIFCSTIGFWAPIEVVLIEMTRIASRMNVSERLDMII